jgi:hypothetical protein
VDRRIRAYFAGHRLLNWNPGDASDIREMVLKHGWDRATTAVDKATSLWAKRKVSEWRSYAWGILARQEFQMRPPTPKPENHNRVLTPRTYEPR